MSYNWQSVGIVRPDGKQVMIVLPSKGTDSPLNEWEKTILDLIFNRDQVKIISWEPVS